MMTQPQVPEAIKALMLGTGNDRGTGHDVEKFAMQQYNSLLGRLIQLERRVEDLENRVL